MPETKKGKKRVLQKYVRIEISVPFPLLSQFDEEAERRGYNRSEAIRATMRDQLERWTGRKL
jgi:metal-responsive CopG/Arc/MetJ family transcriptional regulator